MKVLVKRKKIIIPYKGLVAPFAITGPIDNPYMEDVEKIHELVMRNYPVVEILKDGTRVKLNVTNYDRENGEGSNASMVISYEARGSKSRNKDNSVISIGEDDMVENKVAKMIANSTDTMSKNIVTDIESKNGVTSINATVKAEPNRINVDSDKNAKKKNKHFIDSGVPK